MSTQQEAGQSFGANSWLVEEMYEAYRADPNKVGEAWREFFSDYRSASAPATAAGPVAGVLAAAEAPPAIPPPAAGNGVAPPTAVPATPAPPAPPLPQAAAPAV